MRRVIVYVDGFNLYHAIKNLGDESLKWVCLRRLSESLIRPDEELIRVNYFSAHATWKPKAFERHRAYVAALKQEGVTFVKGKFKQRDVKCRACGAEWESHEEKETDVNIAIHLVRDTILNEFDRAIVISADTDMRSAVVMARQHVAGHKPAKNIDVVAPPGRAKISKALKPIYEIPVSKIRNSRLDDSYTLASGHTVTVPENYKTR